MARAGLLTGHKEIDAKLAWLDPALTKKFGRQALRKSGNAVKQETKSIIEDETDYGEGAYAASFVTRSIPRSKDRIGVSVLPQREKYFAEYLKRYGKYPNPASDESEPFYVPAALEFGYTRGDRFVPPLRAQRRGLYDKAGETIANFRSDMQELVREAAV